VWQVDPVTPQKYGEAYENDRNRDKSGADYDAVPPSIHAHKAMVSYYRPCFAFRVPLHSIIYRRIGSTIGKNNFRLNNMK